MLDANEVQKTLSETPIGEEPEFDEDSELIQQPVQEQKPKQQHHHHIQHSHHQRQLSQQTQQLQQLPVPQQSQFQPNHKRQHSQQSQSSKTPTNDFFDKTPVSKSHSHSHSHHTTTPSISIQPGSPLDPQSITEKSDSTLTLTDPPKRPPMSRSRSSSTNSSYRLPTRTSSMASLSEKQQIVPLINTTVGEGTINQRRQATKVNEMEIFENETSKAFNLDNDYGSQRSQLGRLRAISQPNRRPSISFMNNNSNSSNININRNNINNNSINNIPMTLPIDNSINNYSNKVTETKISTPNIEKMNLIKTLSNNIYGVSEPNIPEPPNRGIVNFDWQYNDNIKRPFQLMKLLAKSIREGAYISPRLYVSPQIWLDSRNVVKLNHIEVKVKVLENILEGLFDVYNVGKKFIQSQVEDEIFLNTLIEFCKILDEIQYQVQKKLDFSNNNFSNNQFNANQNKSSNSVGNWTSKLSRSLGVSNGRKSEEGWLYAYVDLLNKVFVNAQILGMMLYII